MLIRLSSQTKSQRDPKFRTFNGQFHPERPRPLPPTPGRRGPPPVSAAPSSEMDASDDRFLEERSDTNSPRSHMSSPNSASSVNVTEQSLSLQQHQSLETLRMGMFFHAQQMQLSHSLDAVKSRLGLTAAGGQGPRHTIDAILGLSAPPATPRRDDDLPVSPGHNESAGKCPKHGSRPYNTCLSHLQRRKVTS